ncbi:hypothetical protein JVU11DRAFT_6356 [Chiua virens]|nr:hypothetical protein JVU11DRAFT_6356 [Chiua virens]
MTDKLNVSFEPHLQDALMVLLPILPEETSQLLALHLSYATTIPLIPYSLVLKVSRWCQTTDGKAALQACSSPLDPQSYTMTALLAGTRTSPEKHFPPYAAKDPEEEQRLQTKDRKAIATLINAVITVIGTGVATWWAGEHADMRLEWRVLTAVCVALVVAFTEIVLPVRKVVAVRRKDTTEDGSDPDVAPAVLTTAVPVVGADLRHRTITSTID